MNNFSGFSVEISIDLDYEEMVANILYKEEAVATISQEKGVGKFLIEIFPPAEGETWGFPFDGFFQVLQFAKKRLIEMQKLPE